jgi:hypothetical protein
MEFMKLCNASRLARHKMWAAFPFLIGIQKFVLKSRIYVS